MSAFTFDTGKFILVHHRMWLMRGDEVRRVRIREGALGCCGKKGGEERKNN